MARVKQSLVQKPKKAKPITRARVKSIDDKYYGPEPIDITVKGYYDALNWYNYMFEGEQAREWLLEYMKKHNTKQEIAAIKALPKYAIPTTVGWVARMLMNGNVVDTPYFGNRMRELLEQGKALTKKTVTKTEESKNVISIRDRMQNKNLQLLTECEEAVDKDPNLNIYEWLKGKEATPPAATMIREYYARWIPDFEYVDELFTKAEKKYQADQLKYWTQFVDDCDRYIGNKKVTKVRKPRQKKQKSAVDLVKGLSFQKEYPALKIVSVNPAEIVGCAQLWTYNTKTKKLTRFDSSGPNGIGVNRTTLTGFDIEKSVTKTLRKPDITIQSLLGAGKIALRKFMDELKTNETKPSGRINTDTILLRVIK